jgi:hypothetical protein
MTKAATPTRAEVVRWFKLFAQYADEYKHDHSRQEMHERLFEALTADDRDTLREILDYKMTPCIMSRQPCLETLSNENLDKLGQILAKIRLVIFR